LQTSVCHWHYGASLLPVFILHVLPWHSVWSICTVSWLYCLKSSVASLCLKDEAVYLSVSSFICCIIFPLISMYFPQVRQLLVPHSMWLLWAFCLVLSLPDLLTQPEHIPSTTCHISSLRLSLFILGREVQRVARLGG
jgi:hypothetical protein